MTTAAAPVLDRTVTRHRTTPIVPKAPPPGDPVVTWEDVTPDVAGGWLTLNRSNRRLKKSVLAFYVREMTAGRWRQDNPAPIAFDRDGWMIDGQHRLKAVVDSGKTIRFSIARGVDPATRLALDTGVSRTGGDALMIEYPGMDGHEAQSIAAAIRALEAWKRWPTAGPHESIAYRLSNRQVVDLYPAYRPMFDVLWQASRDIRIGGVHGGEGLWLAMLYRFGMISEPVALDFAGKVATGANLPARSPITALRDRLHKMTSTNTKLRRQLVARLIVLGWNNWRQGRLVRNLVIREDVAFPTILGDPPLPYPYP